jgi:hypothetical protein
MKLLKSYLICFLVMLIPQLAEADSVWSFDTGTEEWQIADMPVGGPYTSPSGLYSVTHQSTGGAPGGYIDAEDPSSNVFTLRLPPGALTEIGTLAGGSISFQMKCSHSNWDGAPYLILDCAGEVLLATIPVPTQEWQPYLVPFAAESFFYYSGGEVLEPDFTLHMQNVDFIYIVAEYGADVYELTSLDSVVLIDGDPECDAPVVSISLEEALTPTLLTLHWSAIATATSYRVLELSEPYGLPVNEFITPETSIELPVTDPGHYYQVQSICGE